MDTQKKTMKTGKLIGRFIPYYKNYWGTVAFDLICAAMTTLCELVLPLIVRSITNQAIENFAGLTVNFVLRLGGLYVFLRLIDAAAAYYMASVGHIMGSRIETDMRRDLFAHLQQLSFSYYSNTKVGQIMAASPATCLRSRNLPTTARKNSSSPPSRSSPPLSSWPA
jgi:ATP-binding cassette subfamily B protein